MIILSKFVERLEEFLILRNLTPKMLAKEIKVSHATVLALKRGACLPSTKTLFALVRYFNCSADYLLGLTEDYPEGKVYPPPVSDFGAHFRHVLEETNISQYKLTENGKFSGNLIYKWLHNQMLPSAVNLEKLAKFMEVSVDYLIGLEK